MFLEVPGEIEVRHRVREQGEDPCDPHNLESICWPLSLWELTTLRDKAMADSFSTSVWALCFSLIFNSLSLSENGFGDLLADLLADLQHACCMRWGLSSGIEKSSV